MKKSCNKGFMLVETLIASTFLTTILIILFVQFSQVTNSYDSTFKYNTVNGMYATNNLRLYILADGFNVIRTRINAAGAPFYIDLTECPTNDNYVTKVNYCRKLLDSLKVEKLIVTKDNLTELKANMGSDISQEMKDFINILGTENEAGALRVIVQFTDDTYASIKMVGGA